MKSNQGKREGHTPIYLDNNATTPLDPRVLDSMMPYLTKEYGNANSSSHQYGWKAKAAIDESRSRIKSAINARLPSDIVFTSGATESINLAVIGTSQGSTRGHVITSQIEHKAVLDSCRFLQAGGTAVTYLPPDRDGFVSAESVIDAMQPDTQLVSVMLANNEVGTLQDIGAIGAACRERGILFHTDATQGVGKTPFDVQNMNVDLASFSAHKVYGPKGVGALYIDSNRLAGRLQPQVLGGGHEWGLRSGTLNVPGIVGFGKAVEIIIEEAPEENERIGAMRDALFSRILAHVPGTIINGIPGRTLPGLLNASFEGLDADSLLLELSDFALSSGSACTSANAAPSHVLKAMGRSDRQAQASVRFGLGRFNTMRDVDHLAGCLAAAVHRLRAMAPL